MPWNPEFAEARADFGGYYLNLWTAGLRPAKEIVLLVRAHARKRIDISDGSWLPVRAKRRLEQPALIITCLSPAGRINEAVEMLEKMVESDPLNLRSRSALGTRTIAGAYDRANNELRKVQEIDENA